MSAVREGKDAKPSAIFAALGDPTRLEMLTTLADGGSLPIATLASRSRLTRQAVTKHLRVLEAAGLVTSHRVGRERRFAYGSEPIAGARHFLELVSGRWDAAIDRLRLHVEGPPIADAEPPPR